MEQEQLRRKLKWALVVINVIAGVVWILAAFGVLTGEEGTKLLYLMVGLVSLVASGVWLLNLVSNANP